MKRFKGHLHLETSFDSTCPSGSRLEPEGEEKLDASAQAFYSDGIMEIHGSEKYGYLNKVDSVKETPRNRSEDAIPIVDFPIMPSDLQSQNETIQMCTKVQKVDVSIDAKEQKDLVEFYPKRNASTNTDENGGMCLRDLNHLGSDLCYLAKKLASYQGSKVPDSPVKASEHVDLVVLMKNISSYSEHSEADVNRQLESVCVISTVDASASAQAVVKRIPEADFYSTMSCFSPLTEAPESQQNIRSIVFIFSEEKNAANEVMLVKDNLNAKDLDN